MFLKLTRRRAYAGVEAIRSIPEARVSGTYQSPALKRVLERIKRSEGFRMLDVGVLSGESITTFAQAGARVYVHDLASVLVRPDGVGERSVADVLATVQILPESLDLVCAWDLFDLLTPDEAAQVLARVGRWLSPKGWVLASFNVAEVAESCRFRADPDGTVTPTVMAALSPPKAASTNSQVVKLFSDYRILNSALMRGQFRELLAQRH